MKVFKHININPTNMNLYSTAVTHSSYTNENPSYPDYERLEFLGDAVLEIIISDYLYKERKLEEGIMTKMRASYVCEEACATYAKELGLDEDIRVGTGEEINTTIMADVFEAFVAAVYLDQGFEFTKKFVLDIIVKYIENEIEFLHDYKSKLQELVQTDRKSLEYILVKEEGPAHDKTFEVEVRIDGILYGKGIGNSKKKAEQEAAKEALEKRAKNA